VEDNALLGGLMGNASGQAGNIQDIATTSGSGSLFEDSPFGEGWDKKQGKDNDTKNDFKNSK
jgi:hypothetical protein